MTRLCDAFLHRAFYAWLAIPGFLDKFFRCQRGFCQGFLCQTPNISIFDELQEVIVFPEYLFVHSSVDNLYAREQSIKTTDAWRNS